jgi:hypothetical protein
MATALWWPNSQTTSQIDEITVTAVASGGTLSVTINGKTITYTCTVSDTTTTAAAGLVALLSDASLVPPEFSEEQWTSSAAVITATAAAPGTPVTFTSAGAGGATLTQANVQANLSPSDANNPNNWLRGGTPAIPQSGDDVVFDNQLIPALWNLDSLSAVQFNSLTRTTSMSGQIGLPDQNPAGYLEYRPTHLQFTGSGTVPVLLGEPSAAGGSGPSLERYDAQAAQVGLVALSGQRIDFLGSNASNAVSILNVTLNVAASAWETAALASASADGGGTINLGAGCTFSGELLVNNAVALVNCAPGSIIAQNGSQVTVGGAGLTYAAVYASSGCTITWKSDSSITALDLKVSSTLDKSQDYRPMTITSSAVDGDTCQVLDPLSTITWTDPTTVRNAVTSGPFAFVGPRTVQII